MRGRERETERERKVRGKRRGDLSVERISSKGF